MRSRSFYPILALTLLAGCGDNPFERTKNGSGGGPTGTFGGTSSFVIFSSELMSGGGAFLYPGAEGQSLSFNDRSNPVSERSIRYSWTGEEVAGQHNFAGFDLMHTPTQAEYDVATSGRDLRQAGYNRVTFYARGTLSTNTLLKVEVVDDGQEATINASCVSLSMDGTLDDGVNPGSNACGRLDTLTSSWQKFSIPIASPATTLDDVRDFFKATFVFNDPFVGAPAGQGGTVFIDQIQYEP
jgi:hypothetical protein